MSNSNDFVPWATGSGANIAGVAAYTALAIRQQGAQIGIADPVSFNNAMRQATTVATMVAQFTADYGPGNVQDNGNIPAFEAQFVAALTAIVDSLVTPATGSLYHWGGSDSGSANAYVLTTPSPAIASYVTGTTIAFKPANLNTGNSTLIVGGLYTQPIVRIDGSALQANDLNPTGVAIVVYDGARFVLVDVLQTVSGTPVATTTSNGIAREATTGEMQAGATSGSSPAFVIPEGLSLYSDLKWTTFSRSASGTEPNYNEFLFLRGSSNYTTTLKTPSGVVYAYIISNASGVTQNIATTGGGFAGQDYVGGGGSYLTIPNLAVVALRSDGANWNVVSSFVIADTSNRGHVRLATDGEGTAGVTSGTSPAVMTPERVALFFYNAVANTGARGISRQATTSEMQNGATSGSSPAFVTPEGLNLNNPFLTTGIGAAIHASLTAVDSGYQPNTLTGQTGSWTYGGNGSSSIVSNGIGFAVCDYRWPSSAPPGTWEVMQLTLTQSQNYGGSYSGIALAVWVRTA